LAPTTSALCPYTTLFRSVVLGLRDRFARDEEHLVRRVHPAVPPLLERPGPGRIHLTDRLPPLLRGQQTDRPTQVEAREPDRNHRDRKSTRLNSSHVKISY